MLFRSKTAIDRKEKNFEKSITTKDRILIRPGRILDSRNKALSQLSAF